MRRRTKRKQRIIADFSTVKPRLNNQMTQELYSFRCLLPICQEYAGYIKLMREQTPQQIIQTSGKCTDYMKFPKLLNFFSVLPTSRRYPYIGRLGSVLHFESAYLQALCIVDGVSIQVWGPQADLELVCEADNLLSALLHIFSSN